ncbi:DMT family transporter [Pseudaeromonas sp. ZJS20]|uniref:DMT family transporter n=1 Tax=Pseudaeromonas aegiceratis TaxID=3153928 RepID=UPI00390CAE0B
MNLLYLLMALAGGAGLSIQAAVNSRLSAGLGGQPLVASFFSFAIGTLCLGLAALMQGDWHSVATQVGTQPWWRWLGGIIGATFVFTTVFLAPRIGITNAMFLFIIGQLSAGLCIDSFGLLQMAQRPLYWWKFLGLGLMLLGLVSFMFGDRLFIRH